MNREIVTEPAKVTEADIGFEGHGIFFAFINFSYGGTGQGFGYGINEEFIRRFIKVCGVDRLSECIGRIVMVTHSTTTIHKVEPMKFEEGEPFDVDEWAKRAKERSRN